MKLSELPGWAIAVAFLLLAVIFGHTAFFAEDQFEVAGLRFGPVVKDDLKLENAVIAFDTSKNQEGGPCPRGWDPFFPAASRVVVGAGPGEEKDIEGKPLTPYRAFADDPDMARGGQERVKIGLDQMPEHQHGMHLFNTGLEFKEPTKGAVALPFGQGGYEMEHPKRDQGTLSRGKSEPHNNMPPFIALHFCKKRPGSG